MSPYTRRDFTKLALAALPAAGLLSTFGNARAATSSATKPNSKVSGVHIGLNVPYSFGNAAMSGDDILERCVQLGLSAVELRAQPIEAFLGVPEHLVNTRRAATGGEASKAAPVDPATVKARADELRTWRASVSLDRVREFRRRYEAAGVFIEVLKVDGIFAQSDDNLDYFFTLAKTLGSQAISTEISHKENDLKRVGRFADKHRLMVGYHGHASTKPEHWEHAFALAKYNGANVDLGHFVAGNDSSVVEFIKKHHARVTHVHVKDRKRNNGKNFPFGEGDTPIIEVLRLIRDQRWPIQATIEFEYPIPAGSDRMKELARSIKYCRDALA
jgi:hypothetical protein